MAQASRKHDANYTPDESTRKVDIFYTWREGKMEASTRNGSQRQRMKRSMKSDSVEKL